jgi:hypothetical protein
MRRVGPFAPALHIRKLEAERADPLISKKPRQRFQEWVLHAGTGAVGQYIQETRIFGLE